MLNTDFSNFPYVQFSENAHSKITVYDESKTDSLVHFALVRISEADIGVYFSS